MEQGSMGAEMSCDMERPEGEARTTVGEFSRVLTELRRSAGPGNEVADRIIRDLRGILDPVDTHEGPLAKADVLLLAYEMFLLGRRSNPGQAPPASEDAATGPVRRDARERINVWKRVYHGTTGAKRRIRELARRVAKERGTGMTAEYRFYFRHRSAITGASANAKRSPTEQGDGTPARRRITHLAPPTEPDWTEASEPARTPVFPAAREAAAGWKLLSPHSRKKRSLTDPPSPQRGGSISSRAHAGRLAPAG